MTSADSTDPTLIASKLVDQLLRFAAWLNSNAIQIYQTALANYQADFTQHAGTGIPVQPQPTPPLLWVARPNGAQVAKDAFLADKEPDWGAVFFQIPYPPPPTPAPALPPSMNLVPVPSTKVPGFFEMTGFVGGSLPDAFKTPPIDGHIYQLHYTLIGPLWSITAG